MSQSSNRASQISAVSRRLDRRVVFLVVALPLAAYVAELARHVVRSRSERTVVARIKDAGGTVHYDYQTTSDFLRADAPPRGAYLVRSLFGNDVYATANTVFFEGPTTSNRDVSLIPELPHVTSVWLTGAAVTDACVDDLLRIASLDAINLTSTSISPEGLRRISSSRPLKQVVLRGSSVSDAHLRALSRAGSIEFLYIADAVITDDGVDAVTDLRGLRILVMLECPNVTDAGVVRLTRLEHLCVVGSPLTDACLGPIGASERLRRLTLGGAFSDDGQVSLRQRLPRCYIRFVPIAADVNHRSDETDGEPSDPAASP
jgi:hypothetical protein